MQREIQAWHFVGATLRDGQPIPPDGEWLVHEGEVHICASGLHASVRLLDALRHAPGSTICRVTCRGIVAEQDDKLVCRERRIDWRLPDADDLLRAFARKAALSVIHLWDAPDVVRRYLETGDESIRAAARAASDAASGAARAARAAASDAARDAWDARAARAAAWAASGAARAARAAASDAARDAWDARAASAAAWAASEAAWDARDAALDTLNATFEQMATEARR